MTFVVFVGEGKACANSGGNRMDVYEKRLVLFCFCL